MPDFAVLGATGRMGGATVRALLAEGAAVRALTRRPDAPAAQRLAAAGARVVAADMTDAASLTAAFDGVGGVFNVQPSFDARGRHQEAEERLQGRCVARAVAQAGVPHVVYGSAGTGAPTGIPHFDVKLEIEEALQAACPRVTVLRPAPFMELLTDPTFVPALSTWGVEPRVMGWDTPVPWVATQDVGVVAAAALRQPEVLGGQTLCLAGDVASLREARAGYRRVFGRRPRRLPLPVWLFSRMAGDELVRMWAFIRDRGDALQLDPSVLRSLHPDALTLDAYLDACAATARA